MVTLYYAPSCTSCRKARAWLKAHKIPFVERNIVADPLTAAEIKGLLRMTENGTEELISVRSRTFHELGLDLDDMSMTALLDLLVQTPALIRRPIIADDKRLQVGFNEDEIRRFLPRKVRAIELQQAQLMSGY
ncbi:transcriptional regulator Spx [Lacticaseibacillus mingshuiensis]|uniref:Global transcriptional regulator Spx n=1 Tax=Lacticaseibacillus mingshuiensis TaxID=2799574 RepID=A0ABW4CHM0_9LACO|nr:transcriptional regulator Spx [Lacticaseibacillus mingshuiensis]